MKKAGTTPLQPVIDRLFHFQDAFELQFEREIMGADRQRSRFLAAAVAAIAVLSLLAGTFGQTLVDRLFNGHFAILPVFALLACYALYEWAFHTGIGIFRRKGLKFPPFPKYANAISEASFPSILLFTLTEIFPADTALAMPPVFLYFLIIILSALRLEPWLSVATGLAAAVGYLGVTWHSSPLVRSVSLGEVAWWVAATPHLAKVVIILLAGVMAAFVAGQIRQRLVSVIRSRDERNLIAGIFGQHVTPAVMEKLIHHGNDLDSETREVCVMFLDIRDFTAYSHSRSPDEVVRYLNSLFDFMIDVVNAHHGFINKFLGDGFMAVFGAPLADGEASLNGIRTSLALSDRLAGEIGAGRVDATRIGIGLHSGLAVTGNVGSQARKEYTVIGDVVNLASRIEQLNKHYGSEILVSGDTWEAALTGPNGGAGLSGIVAQELGETTVKGRSTPVRVLRLR